MNADTAADSLKKERQRLDQDWRQRLERCQYEADRAQRQYQAVELEKRLVARELERQWEQSLQQVKALLEDHGQPVELFFNPSIPSPWNPNQPGGICVRIPTGIVYASV